MGSGQRTSDHKRLTLATDLEVYFCDPHSPWQRGTNENTKRLLRQYFPKGTDLSVHSQAKLNVVARELNERPRKTLPSAIRWPFTASISLSSRRLDPGHAARTLPAPISDSGYVIRLAICLGALLALRIAGLYFNKTDLVLDEAQYWPGRASLLLAISPACLFCFLHPAKAMVKFEERDRS